MGQMRDANEKLVLATLHAEDLAARADQARLEITLRLPRLQEAAPVNAPRSCPQSSLSSRLSASALQ